MAEIAVAVVAASHKHDANTLEGLWWAPFEAASHVVAMERGSDFRVPHSGCMSMAMKVLAWKK